MGGLGLEVRSSATVNCDGAGLAQHRSSAAFIARPPVTVQVHHVPDRDHDFKLVHCGPAAVTRDRATRIPSRLLGPPAAGPGGDAATRRGWHHCSTRACTPGVRLVSLAARRRRDSDSGEGSRASREGMNFGNSRY